MALEEENDYVSYNDIDLAPYIVLIPQNVIMFYVLRKCT